MVRGQLKVKLAFKLIVNGRRKQINNKNPKRTQQKIPEMPLDSTVTCPCVCALFSHINSYFYFFFQYLPMSWWSICGRYRVFQNYMQKIKTEKKATKEKKSCASALCTYFVSRSLFEQHKPDERLKKLISFSKFEAVYCTMLNIAHANTHTSADMHKTV